MKKIFLFLFMLFVPFIFYAKELKRDWITNFATDIGDSVINSYVTSDGKYIIAYSNDIVNIVEKILDTDIILAKYDKNGTLLWQNKWGGSEYDSLRSFLLTKNDEIIAVGSFASSNINGIVNKGSSDAVIVKFDNNGKIVWQKSIGGSASEKLNSSIVLNDGTYVSSGYYKSTDIDGISNKGGEDAIIIRYDEDGDIIWQKNFGGSGDDLFSNLVLTKNNEIIACGYSSSTDIDGITNNGNKDILIVKYDENGNILWKKTWGGTENDTASRCLLTENEDIVIVNSYFGGIDNLSYKGGNADIVIVKFDKNGNLIWQKSWGGNNLDYLYSYKILDDGSIIIVGDTESTDIENFSIKGVRDAFLLKYDKNGNLIWQKSWGGSSKDSFTEIDILNNNEIVVLGYASSSDISDLKLTGTLDVVVLKYDKDGNIIWQDSWGGNNSDVFEYLDVVDNGFVIGGVSTSNNIEGFEHKGSNDAFFIKYYYEYLLNISNTINGSATVIQEDNLGIVNSIPDEGYEVDKIIIKDANGDILDVEVTALEDGTYSFPLYTDVSIEVLFKEVLSNPKTGVFDYISFILVGMLICTIGYISINQYNKRFEL